MANEPKARIENIDPALLTEWVKTAKDPIPHSADILRGIVRALLNRIDESRPRDAKYIKFTIRQLAVIDRDRNKWFKSFYQQVPGMFGFYLLMVGQLLAALQRKKLPRSHHHVRMLHLQQSLLTAFLKKHRPQLGVDLNLGTWLKRHNKELLSLLTQVPCFCKQRESLVGLDEEFPDCTGTLGEVVTLILAGLHRSKPENIRKLLKKKTPSKKQPRSQLQKKTA